MGAHRAVAPARTAATAPRSTPRARRARPHPPTSCTPQTALKRSGAPTRGELLHGDAAPVEGEPIVFHEAGLSFHADVVAGQKTGFFLDQRDNRARMQVCVCVYVLRVMGGPKGGS